MFETPDEILRQFRAGEDSRAEFTRVVIRDRRVLGPDRDDLAADMVAFANAEGGTFVIGVDDSGAPLGIPRESLDLIERWVIDIATDRCDPPVWPVLRRALVPGPSGGVAILLAEVRRGVSVHGTTCGRYYLREGSTRRDLRPTELARLFEERGREYAFDERQVFGSAVEGLDCNRLEAFFGRSQRIPWLDLLRNTRVTVKDEEGVDRPTVAGLLAFSSDPASHLRSAYIEAACYGGTRLSSDDLVRAERLAGPVSDQIDAGIAFVMHFMRAGRDDTEDDAYDIDVVDEAVVNAVAHRDYSVSGSKIRLFMFTDRLELYSPGKLPNGITIEQMPYRTFTRNQLLVSFLSKMRSKRTGRVFLKSRGEGVRKVLDGGDAHSGRRPEYELFGKELRLTVWGRGG